MWFIYLTDLKTKIYKAVLTYGAPVWQPWLPATRPELLECYNYEEEKATLPLALDSVRANCPSAYTLITGTRHFLDALKGDVKRKAVC